MGDLRNSTIDNVPQNVEESRYDDKENNEEQFQIEEAVALIWQEDVCEPCPCNLFVYI